MTTTDRPIVYWDCDEDTERLSHTDQDDAILYALDEWLDPTMTPTEVLSTLRDGIGETITVHGFARMEMPTYELFLEHLMEWLDNDLELGDVDGADPPSEALQAGARAFYEVLLKEYTPWSCEVVAKEEVNIEQWIRENKPEWLGSEPNA